MAVDPREIVRRLAPPSSAGEDARSLIQGRVTTLILVVACIWSSVLVFDRIVSYFVLGALFPSTAFLWPNAAILVHAVVAAGLLATWACLRRTRPSLEGLVLLEGAATIGQVVGYCAMYALAPEGHRLFLSPSLGLAHILVLRAAIVPTSPRRTMWIGLLGSGVVLLTSYHAVAASKPAWVTSPFTAILPAFTWSVVTVAATTAISRTIYGLHARVRAAMELGQYTLLDKLGEGGMGTVYRARHALLRRPTAVKLLRSENAQESLLARFEREVQLTADISHPNVVSVYDFGRTPEGSFYYAMEYLAGRDLQRIVDDDGPMPPGRVLRILVQAGDALAEAHAVGLVHRDVKPANMILCDAERRPDHLKIFDFGLVKEVDEATTESQSNVLVGTPHYLSPEAITNPRAIDGRADLYALGAVAYFLLTGLPVFEAKTILEVCARHLHEPVVPPSKRGATEIPPELEALVLACLEKSPEKRPESAAFLRDALRACGGVRPWTDDDARAWWSEHRTRKTNHAGGPVDSITMTIEVGPRDRVDRASARAS